MIDNRKTQPHGGDIYRNKINIDFSVNSNPLGPQPEVIRAICDASGRICCYPDIFCEDLRKAISRFEQIPSDLIICGNGAAELFFAVVLAVKPKMALLLSPTFSEYERALKVTESSVTYYELNEREGFQAREDILEYITPGLDLFFLCNPNNPTGQVIPKEMLLKIAKRCRECQTVLVLDECFVDFLDTPEQYEMKEKMLCYPELVIIKAFTKLFCMPGLRLGYAMCGNEKLLHGMRNSLQPWNISLPAQEAGVAALSNCENYLKKTKLLLAEERKYLIQRLQKAGCIVYGSKANYIFFRAKDEELYEKALKAGFLIRDCSDYRGLKKGYYRIAVRTREENERIIKWLERL